jgi:hypothetical protein
VQLFYSSINCYEKNKIGNKKLASVYAQEKTLLHFFDLGG